MTLLGAYTGNDPAGPARFKRFAGRLDLLCLHTGEESAQDYVRSVGWLRGVFANVPLPSVWSIPLIWAGTTLAAASRGECDAQWMQVAKTLAAHRPSDRVVYVRTGWEQNGDWMKWAAAGSEKDFNVAFARFASVFRAVSNRFRLIWCPNIGQNNPELTYPGDEYVDVIGLDVYHQPRWDPKEPDVAWTYMVTREYGLQWHLHFARARRRPIAFPEWGVSSDGFEYYIRMMAEWFRASDAIYHGYWDSNADYRGELSSGQYPTSAAAFKAIFGA